MVDSMVSINPRFNLFDMVNLVGKKAVQKTVGNLFLSEFFWNLWCPFESRTFFRSNLPFQTCPPIHEIVLKMVNPMDAIDLWYIRNAWIFLSKLFHLVAFVLPTAPTLFFVVKFAIKGETTPYWFKYFRALCYPPENNFLQFCIFFSPIVVQFRQYVQNLY
jgi:hypothetical protein